jgi:hypothetical protein
MAPNRPATRAGFRKITKDLDERLNQRVEPAPAPEVIEEPPPVIPRKDNSTKKADLAAPDDIQGLPMPEPSDDVIWRSRPIQEPFLGRVVNPDDPVERKHLGCTRQRFPCPIRQEIEQGQGFRGTRLKLWRLIQTGVSGTGFSLYL